MKTVIFNITISNLLSRFLGVGIFNKIKTTFSIIQLKFAFCLLFIFLNFSFFIFQSFSQGVAINVQGNEPDAKALLDVSGTDKGVLIPRMTTAERDAILAPPLSLLIYNISSNCFESYVDGAWNIVSCPATCIPPAQPVAITGSATVCESQSEVYSIIAVPLATYYSWTLPTGWSIFDGQGTISLTVITGNSSQSGNVNVTANNSCGASVPLQTIHVTVDHAPVASAGGSQTICQTGTATVSGASSSNGTILWTENGAGSITAGTTTLTPTYTPAAGDAGNTVTLTMTVTSNNSCTPATATATYTVNVSATPTASAGGSQTICQNGTATVSGASSTNGTILWTENGAGSITAGATTLTPTYTPAAGDAGNTVTLTMTVSNSPCTPATATYTVNVNALPTATAGGSQTICQNGTATVSGASSSNGTILWTENGAGSITADATTLTPTYTAVAGDAGNTVTLTMTVTSNNVCTPAIATATYTVYVNGIPTASAGGSQTVCQNGTATVSGASSSNGTILWTENGAGSITAGATTLTPTYTAAAGDAGNTVTLTMTVSNSPCTPANATYSVNVTALPTASAGGSQTICQNGTATVSGASSSNGTILWTENGAGSITSGATTLTPTYTAAAGDAGNTVTLTMTVSNSPCTPATATYTVNVNALPTASAGGSQTICQNGTATVSGASSSNGTILWTENGAGSITSGATTLTPTYTAAAGDAGNTVTLTMTVTSNNACTPATATATYSVTVNASPANPGAPTSDDAPCGNVTLTRSGSPPGGETWYWQGTSCGISTVLGSASTYSANSSGTYYIRSRDNTTLCWSAGCGSITVTVNPYLPVSVSISANPSGGICSGTSVTFTAVPTNGGTPTYQWKVNGGNVGTNSSTYTSNTLANGNTVTCVLTSNIACPSGNPATSNSITMTVTTTPVISSTGSTNPSSPCGGSGDGNITLNGLTASTTYSVSYLKDGSPQGPTSIATNGSGILTIPNLAAGTYSNIVVTLNGCSSAAAGPITLSAPTPGNCGTVTDASFNTYNTVVIGTQCWMKENLKTTKYRNSTVIPNVTDDWTWMNLSTGAYCDYDNNPANSVTYGKLYNWYAATNVNIICPTDWHLPSETEWFTMINYLGGVMLAGDPMKETGTTHWLSPNGASNCSGFTGLPGGYRNVADGSFRDQGHSGYSYGMWWGSTTDPDNPLWASDITLSHDNGGLNWGYGHKGFGWSVRCVHD